MNHLKHLYVIILPIILTGNIMAMESTEQIERDFQYGESLLSQFSNELLIYIIEQGYREDILNWNDIFKEPKINLGKMQGLAATSKAWRALYIQTFNDLNILKIQRLQKLEEQIKEEYKNFSTDQLNQKLSKILEVDSKISEEDLKLAVRLIIAGADVNFTDRCGFTVLTWASGYGYKEIVAILIKLGANVNGTNKCEKTALTWASSNGHKEILELLIKAGADVNIPDQFGYTALMHACQKGCRDIVEILIEKDASINVINFLGETAISIAKKHGCEDIVKLLQALVKNDNDLSCLLS
ncbi:ankyrin repeat domain-containing protein [Candidatus Babela massiliensis]|uniref:Ankyrin repeats containing protein n=1 Tax=Candidatus Babela massiliensis TaxID=673862 RepID=V6DKK6_9BACT|nr:ankyrin repeat domain-containing protein [Candidatus Babela massiliensis]CDK31041.1 Ankyrin repeats containing protein [Candidatus Babela massiliensis]